jgi:hypothetical protein
LAHRDKSQSSEFTVALVNVSCGDSILVESILRENYQQKGFHAAKTRSGRAEQLRALRKVASVGDLFFWLQSGRP